MSKSITIISGGLDSTTLAHALRARGVDQVLISFDYGQRHKKELIYAGLTATRLGYEHHIIDLTSVGTLLTGSALTSGKEVPDGYYSEDSMRQTVVPNRNAIMLAIAWGIAIAEGAHIVATAVHAGDHAIYPDCRSPFIAALTSALKIGTEGFADENLHIHAPYLHQSKAQIVRDGSMMVDAYGRLAPVPYEEAWSCYKGGAQACGKCGTCTERLEAFWLAGCRDPLPYEDKEWWKTVSTVWNNGQGWPDVDMNANAYRDTFLQASRAQLKKAK